MEILNINSSTSERQSDIIFYSIRDNHLFLNTNNDLFKILLSRNPLVVQSELDKNEFKFTIPLEDSVNFSKFFEPVKMSIESFNFKEKYSTDFFVELKTKYSFTHLF